jgi:hypothetical protein
MRNHHFGHLRSRGVAALAAIAALPWSAAAQPVTGEAGSPFVLERVVQDRWLHGGQHPGFVAFENVRSSTHLRHSVTGGVSRNRSLQMRLQNIGARYFMSPTYRLLVATIDQPPVTYTANEDARQREDSRRRRLRGNGALQNLPESRFWEVPFALPATPLARGTSWTDTLSYVADPGEGLWESLSGVWHHEVVGDTVMDGRRLPLVRTTAEVHYRSRELERDYALTNAFGIERDVAGTIIGHAAVDTAVGVRATGADTTRLHGTATLHSSDGRSFTSPVRYERQRTWLLRDSTAWAVVQDSLQEERRRQSTGMLMLPGSTLAERLRGGDQAGVDSLLTEWRDTADPNVRVELEGLLLRWAATDAAARGALQQRLNALRLQAGDSAGVIATELQTLNRRERLTAERLELLLPYLDDIGRLWQIGVLPRFEYTELGTTVLQSSPVLRHDPAQWLCEPAACDALTRLLDSAAEPRLRDVALVGAFAREPERWYDRLVQRAEGGSVIAQRAVLVADGVGSTWPAGPQLPMPEAGADWRRWLAWMGGTVRWERSHMDAMRMYAARTGRDPVAELLDRWPTAEDSARLVFGAILRGVDALDPATADELRRMIVSGSAAEHQVATRQLEGRIRAAGAAPPPELAIELLRPLLDSIAARGDSPWPALHDLVAGAGGRLIHGWAVEYHGVRDVPIYVLDEGLPAEVMANLPAPFRAISREAWDARPLRAGGALVTVQPPIHWEGFSALNWNWTVRVPRAENEAPAGYVGGGGLILLSTPDGWRVVHTSAWIS